MASLDDFEEEMQPLTGAQWFSSHPFAEMLYELAITKSWFREDYKAGVTGTELGLKEPEVLAPFAVKQKGWFFDFDLHTNPTSQGSALIHSTTSSASIPFSSLVSSSSSSSSSALPPSSSSSSWQ
eukprot:TRINITY_DN1810_c0_g1_i1.p1 TRINITY_DN1810_c0_g1~~TRINITY_DN1810_c0_g1_i1.p1  ORF type:complete len:137 (+),score=68.17 TRINITY_DN1810_c0_g1_i1:37-411(+)